MLDTHHVDRHNLIIKDTRIGWDAEQDRERYTVSLSGVVVVPQGRAPHFARESRSFWQRLRGVAGCRRVVAHFLPLDSGF